MLLDIRFKRVPKYSVRALKWDIGDVHAVAGNLSVRWALLATPHHPPSDGEDHDQDDAEPAENDPF